EPCARLTRSMMPKTSVSPAASKNSSKPNCRPLRHCSMNSVIVPPGEGLSRDYTRKWRQRTLPPFSHRVSRLLHRTLRSVRVRLIFLGGRRGLLRVGLALFHHRLHVVVLRRIVVGAEFEAAAHRLEVGLFQRLLHGRLVRQVALHR